MSLHVHPSSRPGQMTTVMRTVRTTTGPKVLRIALVQSGRVIEERVIPPGSVVTIGPNERSTFVVSDRAVTRSLSILTHRDGAYFLDVSPAMSGRVALASGLVSLDEHAAREPLRLDDDARGKIVIGSATLLFHFIHASIAAPRPKLPLAVQRGLIDHLDWRTTFIAAFSFLFHFGAIGSLYSDWSDPVIDDEARVATLLESMKQLPGIIAVEEKSSSDTAPSTTPKETESKAPSTPVRAANDAPSKGPSGADKGGRAGPMTDVAARRLADQITAMDGLMTLGLNAPGRATDGVLRDGNMPVSLLDDAAGNAGGVHPSDGIGLHLDTGPGGVVHPGSTGSRSLAGNLVGSSVPAESGKAIDVKKPVGVATVSPPNVIGEVSDAAAVVGGMRAGFRACYNRGLLDDPSMKGAVRITVSIGPNGEVRSAQPSMGGGSLSSSVIACLTGRVRSGQFSPPSNGGATLVIPVVFATQ